MPATQLELQICHGESRTTVIEAIGEIDLSSAPRLRDALMVAVEHDIVVLDAAEISFCDSLGLRTLIEAYQAAHDRGTSFRLAACSPPVFKVIELAEVLDYLEIFPDVETALAS